MGERGLEFKVGLLIVISSAILVAFIFVLGNFSLRSGYTLYVDYDYIGALQPGAPVKVSGIKVGKVDSVEFLGGKQDPKLGKRVQVRVSAWIEDRARDSIRGDAEFFINTAGVLGEQYLEIVPGHDWDHPAIAADTVIHGPPAVHDPPRTDLVVARLYEVLDGVSSVLHDDRDAIKHLLSNGANAVAEINKLLVDRREQLGDLIASTADVAKEAKVTLAKINNGLGDGRPVANLLADADTTLKTAQSSLSTLTPSAQTLMTDATRVTGIITEQRIDKAIDAAGQGGGGGRQGGRPDRQRQRPGDRSARRQGHRGCAARARRRLQRSARNDPRPQAESLEAVLEGIACSYRTNTSFAASVRRRSRSSGSRSRSSCSSTIGSSGARTSACACTSITSAACVKARAFIVAGRQIGKIETIALSPRGATGPLGGDEGVVVMVAIDAGDAARLDRGGDVFVASRGALSERYLELGPAPEPGTPLREGDQLLGRDPPSLDRVVQRTWDNLTTLGKFAAEIKPEFDGLRAQIDELRGHFDATAQNLALPSIDKLGPLIDDAVEINTEIRHVREVGLGGEAGMARIAALVVHARAVVAESRTSLDKLAASATAPARQPRDGARAARYQGRRGDRRGRARDRSRARRHREDGAAARPDRRPQRSDREGRGLAAQADERSRVPRRREGARQDPEASTVEDRQSPGRVAGRGQHAGRPHRLELRHWCQVRRVASTTVQPRGSWCRFRVAHPLQSSAAVSTIHPQTVTIVLPRRTRRS